MNNLEVSGLTKQYGNRIVVDNISFRVLEGEFFVVLGPSGGGKTTLLRLLCGLEKPDSGQIILAGRDVTKLPPRERNIGMVFQEYGLYPHMNVYQNIAYGLEARAFPKGEIEKRVPAAAAKMGLTPHLKSSVVDLSGGEQQRVALARAMVKDADLYLFDEPLSNLDPKLRAQARKDIQMVHREKHKPSIYVTHDQTEALAIGDRIAVIANGRLQQVGTAVEIVESPANAFVASFIGSPPMNLITGKLYHDQCGFGVEFPDFKLPLPGQWEPILSNYDCEEIAVGVRPTSVEDANSAAAHSERIAIIQGTVTTIEPLIMETIVTLNLGKVGEFNVLFQTVNDDLTVGQNLSIAIPLDQVHLFHPRTGTAILPMS